MIRIIKHNNMRVLTFILLIGISAGLFAQKKNSEFAQVDKIILQIPDSLTKTTKGLSDYINFNFTSQTDKSRAIFTWIASNVEYDIENMFAINFYQHTDEIIDKVLKTNLMNFMILRILNLNFLKKHLIS